MVKQDLVVLLNVFELAKKFIKAGAAGVHFEDQLASEKKCGHMGGKVLVPTSTMIKNLKAVRLAADIADVPLIILARTDANAAKLITNDYDKNDKPFLTGEKDLPRASFMSSMVLNKQYLEAWRMRHTATSFGVRRRNQIFKKQKNLLKQFMKNFQVNF